MKPRSLLLGVLLASLRCLEPGARAADPAPLESAADAPAPAEVVRGFYGWYVRALVAGGDPLTDNRAQLQKYVSASFLRRIEKARRGPDGLDADPFLETQDFDKDWAVNISLENVDIQGEKAAVRLTLTGRELGPRKLNVTLVREREAWKLDTVQGQR